jgi:hypothetical protein
MKSKKYILDIFLNTNLPKLNSKMDKINTTKDLVSLNIHE